MKKFLGLTILLFICKISFAEDLNITGTWVSIKTYKDFMNGSVSTINDSDVYPFLFDIIKKDDNYECRLKKYSESDVKFDSVFSDLYEYNQLVDLGDNKYELVNIRKDIKIIFSFGETITEIPTLTTGKKTFIKHKEKKYTFDLLYKDEKIVSELPLYLYDQVVRSLKEKADIQNMQQYKPLERRNKN